MKNRIKTSKKDKRHTTKPYTYDMWQKYASNYFLYTTEQLAYKYGVSKNTIYCWTYEMRKKITPKEIENAATKVGIKCKENKPLRS